MVFNTDLTQALELGFLLELAEFIVVSGLVRKESRGAHARPYDYPERDDENFLRHTLVTWEDGGPWAPLNVIGAGVPALRVRPSWAASYVERSKARLLE